MTRRLSPTHRTPRIAALAALSLATIAGANAEARGQAPRTDAAARPGTSAPRFSPEYHPLDAATVRKVVAVMRAWTPPPPPKPTGADAESLPRIMEFRMRHMFISVVARELSEQDSTATIDATPPLRAALVREGLSSREFAKGMLAFKAAQFANDINPLVPHTPTAVVQQNIAVIRGVGASHALPSWW
jgi:hypothetical protein